MTGAIGFVRAARWALTLTILSVVAPAAARADRVLVLHPEPADDTEAAASDSLLARVEGATIAALVSMGHEPVRDTSTSPPADSELVTVGTGRGAVFVLRVRATPAPSGYLVQASAYDVRSGARREGSGEIVPLREVSQLALVLTPLLVTDAGATDADVAPEVETAPETGGATEAEPGDAPAPADTDAATTTTDEPAFESEASAREAFAERERERQATAKREAWEGRERYGVPARMLLQGGIALRPIANPPDAVGGAVMGAVELRFGYGFPEVPGLELRGSVEGAFGTLNGFSLMGGLVYLFSPFVDAPVHFGPGFELGWLQAFADGFQQAFFALRASHVVSWGFGDQWYLEGAVPEIGLLTGGDVVVTVGLAARVGRRF